MVTVNLKYQKKSQAKLLCYLCEKGTLPEQDRREQPAPAFYPPSLAVKIRKGKHFSKKIKALAELIYTLAGPNKYPHISFKMFFCSFILYFSWTFFNCRVYVLIKQTCFICCVSVFKQLSKSFNVSSPGDDLGLRIWKTCIAPDSTYLGIHHSEHVALIALSNSVLKPQLQIHTSTCTMLLLKGENKKEHE